MQKNWIMFHGYKNLFNLRYIWNLKYKVNNSSKPTISPRIFMNLLTLIYIWFFFKQQGRQQLP